MTRAVSSIPVSIRPDSFTDDQPDLSILSLEEVVARFKDTEKRRTIRSEPDNEAEVLWRLRSTPWELLSSLKVVSAKMGVSRSVLTKCMSRQLVDWYANSLGLESLSNEYNSIYENIKLQAYSTLRIQAENPASFSFLGPEEVAHTSLSTIRWAIGKLSDIKETLGVNEQDLFSLGLMWSLTTLENRDWDRRVVDKFFSPEVYNFETLIADRRADIVALRVKYEYRETTNYNDRIFVREKGKSGDENGYR